MQFDVIKTNRIDSCLNTSRLVRTRPTPILWWNNKAKKHSNLNKWPRQRKEIDRIPTPSSRSKIMCKSRPYRKMWNVSSYVNGHTVQWAFLVCTPEVICSRVTLCLCARWGNSSQGLSQGSFLTDFSPLLCCAYVQSTVSLLCCSIEFLCTKS